MIMFVVGRAARLMGPPRAHCVPPTVLALLYTLPVPTSAYLYSLFCLFCGAQLPSHSHSVRRREVPH